jgi:LuxR family transcriptional regulator, maltose regulon positive regulatory protein
MIAGGRGEAWRMWMSWLGPAEVVARPWLWYWHGMSLLDIRPTHARAILARAERAFQSSGERVARLLSIAAIIDSYDGEWSDPCRCRTG